jgi:hypothetical protein
VSYYRQDDVRLLIENCMAWVGDGVVQGPRSCIVLRALRSIRQEFVRPRLPVTLGIEAGHTQTTLTRMQPKLRRALVIFHTSDLTFAMQAREHLGVSKRIYHLRLEEAHPTFIETYEDVIQASKGRRAALVAAAI